MSISDELMWNYRAVLLKETPEQINTHKKAIASGEQHPMELKKNMANAIVSDFWGKQAAQAAQHQFEELFQKKHYEDGV